MPPEKNSNQLYSVYKTTIWFAVASVILLLSLVVMVFGDSSREWKRWQKKFVEFEREKVEKEIEKAKEAIDPEKLTELQNKAKEARQSFEQKKNNYNTLLKERDELNLELSKVKIKYQDLKQYSDSYKYYFEESRLHHHDKEMKEYEEKLNKVNVELEKYKLEQEALEKKVEVIELGIQNFQAEEKAATKELAQLLKDQTLLEKKFEKLKDSPVKEILNAPMLDFIAPSLQIQQVVLEDLHDDFYFAKSQKVDRCTTCHLAIDRKGFEDAPQPFKTHPNLDLYLSATSPHALEKVGCTVCHGGSGQSLSFTYAAHTPQNEEQAKEWKKKYHWHELHKWEKKMLPLQNTQASCTSCHQGVVNVPQAPKLNEGRQLAMQYGCFGCHTVKGFENQWKVGPNLEHIQSKVNREWIVRWLQNPKSFRPSTQMPSIFHLENVSSDEDRLKSNIAIEGIARYLMKNSDQVALTSPPKMGDPEIGKKLVKEVGCLGCHSVDDAKVNNHGPELIHMGSKVTPAWLFTWLKDPKHFSPATRMPNLRLTDEETTHITSYLLQSKNKEFDEKPTPKFHEKDLDQFAFNYLSQKMRRSEAKEQLAKMDLDAKFQFIGKEMISQQGCYGCHDIRGFEKAKPIGTELTKEGQKEIDKLDFGFIDIPKTRQAWFFQKLKHPRSFDQGKVKTYQEKLRMPEFGFTDEQANSLVTFILSLREENIPVSMQRQLDLRDQEVERGRHVVAKFNCQGCHTLDGVEGRIGALTEDKGNAPPTLEGEGKKVQEEWLYQFLHNPTTIRPWLKYRMPTFGFDDAHLNALIKYFGGVSKEEVSFSPNKNPEVSPEHFRSGRELFIKFKCIQCHQPGESQGMTASFLAPDLVISKDRLKANWVLDWLKDPQALQPGTQMPTFFPDGTSPVQDILGGDTEKQIESIRDYLWKLTPEEVANIKNQK